ncbi:MAG: hypothetical protein AB1638_12605, partial [Nitrospirota bacterium]
HLSLLSTSPHGDAVTFSYRPESVCLKGTFTPLAMHASRRTHSRENGNPEAKKLDSGSSPE